MNEYPRDNVMWMEAFNAKYDDGGRFEGKEWDQLLGHYSVGLIYHEPISRLRN